MRRRMERQKIIALIEEVADDFYQNQNAEGIKKMPELVKKLADIAETMNQEEQKKYCIAMKNLADAYEQKNYVMVADGLAFEIIKIVEK